MQAQFWFDSWQQGGEKTGFHRQDFHPYVLKYFPPEKLVDKKVLIPLCGKTLDMVYFHQHAAHVTGVELVESAVLQFFADHNLPFEKRDNRYEAKQLTIICGDFLTLTRDDVGHIDLVYDRASLVALPSTMRMKYVGKVNEFLPIGGQQFITTLEYFPLWNEPPFSVTPKLGDGPVFLWSGDTNFKVDEYSLKISFFPSVIGPLRSHVYATVTPYPDNA